MAPVGRPVVGCSTLLYGGHDLDTALQHIAWAGYDGIELCAIAGMAEHADLSWGASEAAEVRRRADARGLRILHLGVHAGICGSEGERRVSRAMALAARLEVPLVLTNTGGSPDEAGLARAVAAATRLAAQAGIIGVQLGVKPHVGSAVRDSRTAAALLREVGSPALGLDFDVSHFYRAGEAPVEAFRQLGPSVFTLRVRDVPGSGGEVGVPEAQVPGRGVLDIAAFLREVRASGYDRDVSVDIVGARDYPAARVTAIAAETRGYLRRCMQEAGW